MIGNATDREYRTLEPQDIRYSDCAILLDSPEITTTRRTFHYLSTRTYVRCCLLFCRVLF